MWPFSTRKTETVIVKPTRRVEEADSLFDFFRLYQEWSDWNHHRAEAERAEREKGNKYGETAIALAKMVLEDGEIVSALALADLLIEEFNGRT